MTKREQERSDNPKADAAFNQFQFQIGISYGDKEEDWGEWWDLFFAGYILGIGSNL